MKMFSANQHQCGALDARYISGGKGKPPPNRFETETRWV
jgi:hypothetical protein